MRLRVKYSPSLQDIEGEVGGPQRQWVLLHKYISRYVDIVDKDEDILHAWGYSATIPDVLSMQDGFIQAYDSNRLLNRARSVIACAEILKLALCRHIRSKVKVIHNGVCFDEWKDVPPNSFGLSKPYILVKGYHPFVEQLVVVADAIKLRPDLHFVALGWHRNAPRPLVDNLTVLEVPFPFDSMRGLMNDCAVYVSPFHESFGTLTVEAWACHKPVLALAITGNLEVLARDENIQGGRLYTSAEELAHLFDEALGSSWGEEGYEQVLKYYGWERLAMQFFDHYLSMME